MKHTVALLRNVPLLAELSDELLAQLTAHVEEVRFGAGEWIFQEGERADSMFIVRSGHVEVVDQGPPETLIRVLRRGQVLGELALLREASRSASARARRETELLALHRPAFEQLILNAPRFALGLTRSIGAQLAASHTPLGERPGPRTIAVVALDRGVAAAEVADELTEALRGHGTVAMLSSGELAAVERAEAQADRVILSTRAPPGDAWTDLSLREADLVMAVSSSGALTSAWNAHAQALQGCELMILGPGVADGTLAALQPRHVQVARQRTRVRPALDASARRLAGKSLGIVFSGGGARALAHLGVLEELRDAGLQIDRAAGASLGALVAAFAATGASSAEIYDALRRGFVETNPTNDYSLPAYALIRGGKTRRLLSQAFGERRIEELPVQFFSVSCDLIGRAVVIHRTGSLAEAVYASLAIPGLFPPVATADRRLLVDGGVLDNLPVATMARTHEGPVIAVDVAGRTGDFTSARRRRGVLGAPIRRLLTGSAAEIPRLGDTIVRTVMIGSADTAAAARLHADLVIAPPVGDVGLMEWKQLRRMRDLGRRAAHDALTANPDALERLSR